MRLPKSPFWPANIPHTLDVPDRNLYEHLQGSALQYPAKTAIDFYGKTISYAELHRAVLSLAGYLQHEVDVKPGDRVVLQMQNCPQFVMSYFAVLRANAVVVAINPMCTPEELKYYIEDCGANVLITMQDHLPGALPLLELDLLQHCIVGAYGDHAGTPADVPWLNFPPFVSAPRQIEKYFGVHDFLDVIQHSPPPGPLTAKGADLAVLSYTSGTTGKPKGAMLSHRALAHSVVGRMLWHEDHTEWVDLLLLPLSHLAATQSMNVGILIGRTFVIQARWDASNAIELIERNKINVMAMVTPMLIDFMAHAKQPGADLSSVKRLFCSATATPEAVSDAVENRLKLKYIESYGMTETCGGTHVNPLRAPRRNCGGIAFINVDSRILDPETGVELGPNQPGEIVTHGPTLFNGYWNRPDATRDTLIEIDGLRFIRTGDIGYYDEDGYFYITDRLKRMINASGLKVWPAEIESWLFDHPAVQDVCVISAQDPHRGETVKAFIILRPAYQGKVQPEEITEWARNRMAAYKVPRIVEFLDQLPRTASGKVLWRQLQDEQNQRDHKLHSVAH